MHARASEPPAPGLGAGKLNGDTKIADVGKKVYEGCFREKGFYTFLVRTKVDERPDPTKEEVAQLFFLSLSFSLFHAPFLPLVEGSGGGGGGTEKEEKYAKQAKRYANKSRFRLSPKPLLFPPFPSPRKFVYPLISWLRYRGTISIWITRQNALSHRCGPS